jgi:putative YhbY family RNA-binding protein
MPEKKQELKRLASTMRPQLTVGKNQVTEGTITELRRILETQEIVKVKFLKSAGKADREQMISRLAKETRSELIETRGNTMTLFRPHGGTAGKIYKPKSRVRG